jgi:TonB family protein
MSKWLLLAFLTGGALSWAPQLPLSGRPDVCEGPVPISTVEPVVSPLVYSGGFVVTRVRVAPDGSVAQVEVLSPFPALTEPVEAAVRQWRFTPATRDGRAVEGCVVVAVQISLNRAVLGQGGPGPGSTRP